MSLRVYNTLTREKETFQPVTPGKVKMYVCGMTVYKPPHIGHLVGPVIFDSIKRYLVHRGFEVTWVVNITDVDDKLIEKAKELGTSVEALAEKNTQEYFTVLKAYGVTGIDHFPKASQYMNEIVALAEKLIEKGFAYAVDGNVWFDVSKDSDYGKLSHRRVEDQEGGTRSLEASGKRNAADFSLWKKVKEGEPAWDSPWGKGRPGWHIECSAMSMKLLGETFDFHGGGMDLLFPHHENEIAQSESATGKPFAKFWMHNGLTRIKTKMSGGEWADEKMSGSIGNVVSARELVETHGAEVMRYFLISTHYRRPIEFTEEALANAKKGYSVFARLFERIARLSGVATIADDASEKIDPAYGDLEKAVAGMKGKFLEMMEDDFNTAGAIAVMHELAGEINGFIERQNLEKEKNPVHLQAAIGAATGLRNLGRILGLFMMGDKPAAGEDQGTVDGLMKLLIQLRADARKRKDFAVADTIRKGLTEIGITLEDRADQTIWRKE
jgi:cysteinyl-tRNA synthetase